MNAPFAPARCAARPALPAAAAGLLLLAVALPAPAQPKVEVVAAGLETPWALAFASQGRLFVTERPGRIRLVASGRLDEQPVAVLPVAERGESGLLGLALDPRFEENGHLYVCYTTEGRAGRRFGWILGRFELVNRVARLTFRDGKADHEVVLLDDMPAARRHDGCRLKFGPDGKLYVTMGDANEPELAQRRESPAGKILRLNADGSVPSDNPFPGSHVYSLGHRNPQGLDIDPILESGDDTWAPSGIAIRGDELFVAGLRGRRLLRITLGPDLRVTRVATLLDGTHGRLRDVVVGPDGALYVTTSNRDGRGQPAAEDDRILRVLP